MLGVEPCYYHKVRAFRLPPAQAELQRRDLTLDRDYPKPDVDPPRNAEFYTWLSKFLTWVLRHSAGDPGPRERRMADLHIDTAGWIRLQPILDLEDCRRRTPPVTPDEVKYVVATSHKIRFHLSDQPGGTGSSRGTNLAIRAAQGHLLNFPGSIRFVPRGCFNPRVKHGSRCLAPEGLRFATVGPWPPKG